MIIKKGDSQKVSDNFKASDFFSHTPGVQQHEFDEKLFSIAESLRNESGGQLKITSTYRPVLAQIALTGRKNSAHCLGIAIDISFPIEGQLESWQNYITDEKTQNQALDYFQSIGVNGLGVYDWGLHCDTRTPQNYNFGKQRGGKLFAFWDWRTKKKAQ